MPIRPNSKTVEVYNEGLAVYLYDPANAPEIASSKVRSLFDYADIEPSKDKVLKDLTERGLIVTYYLQQDDPIVVEVSVGLPLSKVEIKALKIPWMKPIQTVISLPGGHLRIDTPNTCRLNEDAQFHAQEYEKKHGKLPADDNIEGFGLEDKSGNVRVPAGDYVLTLYRVDFDKIEEPDDDEEESESDLPGEFITLTPAAEIERPKKIPRVIEYGAGHTRYPGLNTCKVENGKFVGRALGGNGLNLRWKHAQQLGLKRGQRLKVTHDGKLYDAVYLAGIEPRTDESLFKLQYPDKLSALHSKLPGGLIISIASDSITNLTIGRVNPLNPNQWLISERISPLEIEPTDEFLLSSPEEPSDSPDINVDENRLEGPILAHSDDLLMLAATSADLRKIGVRGTSALTLSIGGVETPFLYLGNAGDSGRPPHIAGTANAKDAFFTNLFSYMYQGGDDVFCAMVGIKRSERIHEILKEYAAGSDWDDYKGYMPRDKEAAASIKKESIEIWNIGMEQWARPEAMYGWIQPHWDDPARSVLRCKPINWNMKQPYGKTVETRFVLIREE